MIDTTSPSVGRKRLTTLEELELVAMKRGSVSVTLQWKIHKVRHVMPAAFVLGFPGQMLLNLFRYGRVFVYKPKRRKKKEIVYGTH